MSTQKAAVLQKGTHRPPTIPFRHNMTSRVMYLPYDDEVTFDDIQDSVKAKFNFLAGAKLYQVSRLNLVSRS